MLEVHAIDNAHGSGGDEVARNDAHRGAGHGRVGQALAERRLDFVTQLSRSLLRTVQRHLIGDAHAVGVLGGVPLGLQLLVHLGAKTVDQHHFDTHALNQGQVLGQVRQFAGCDGFTRNAHDKGLAAVHVDVGGHRPKPGDKGEIKDCRHGMTKPAGIIRDCPPCCPLF